MAMRSKQRKASAMARQAMADITALLDEMGVSDEVEGGITELHIMLLEAWVRGHNAVADDPLQLAWAG